MFSFITWLQTLLKNAKRNKGLWFTLLTLLSVAGIIISMTTIHMMSNSTLQDIYIKLRQDYESVLSQRVTSQQKLLLSIGSIISGDSIMLNAIKAADSNQMQSLAETAIYRISETTKISQLNINIYEGDNLRKAVIEQDSIEMAFYQKTPVSGFVIKDYNVYLCAIIPVLEGDNTIGVVEVTQDISEMRLVYENEEKEFAFFINAKELRKLNVIQKEEQYKAINNKYEVKMHDYDNDFFINAAIFDFKKFINDGFLITKSYYTTYTEVFDVSGKSIGIILVGENAEAAETYVNMANKLANNITTVALGLVVAMILFMF